MNTTQANGSTVAVEVKSNLAEADASKRCQCRACGSEIPAKPVDWNDEIKRRFANYDDRDILGALVVGAAFLDHGNYRWTVMGLFNLHHLLAEDGSYAPADDYLDPKAAPDSTIE